MWSLFSYLDETYIKLIREPFLCEKSLLSFQKTVFDPCKAQIVEEISQIAKRKKEGVIIAPEIIK